MFKNKLGKDSPIPKCIHLKIRRRDGIESLTTLEEGEFKVPIDGCKHEKSRYKDFFHAASGYIKDSGHTYTGHTYTSG